MILAKLKEATRDQHEELENVVDVMNRTFSIADYKELLAKFYRFYAAIEPTLPVAELADAGFDVEARRKTPLLERDMEHLGILGDAKKAPPFTDIPMLDTVAKAFGSIYVMEGATLGGQVITRQLKEHLGITAEKGGAFLNSYGYNVGPMWKALGASVTAFAESADDDESIINAARETFDSFRRCFDDAARNKTAQSF
ncbi:MAG: biliverdin-producing heme oxygenase [Pyrinomonadaceae bacterium]